MGFFKSSVLKKIKKNKKSQVRLLQNPETSIKLLSYFVGLFLFSARHWLLFICHLTRKVASSPFLPTSEKEGGVKSHSYDVELLLNH